MASLILEERARRNIQHLYTSLGFTQSEIADLAGVSRVQINRVINAGDEPKLKTCETLAIALGLDPMALLLPAEEFDRIAENITVTHT